MIPRRYRVTIDTPDIALCETFAPPAKLSDEVWRVFTQVPGLSSFTIIDHRSVVDAFLDTCDAHDWAEATEPLLLEIDATDPLVATVEFGIFT
jgi:hypothetical protein